MLFALVLCASVQPTQAQQTAIDDDTSEPAAVPVVQSTTPSPTRALNAALARLARDPRDVGALTDAGSAALDLGDTDAAIGFFTRADEVSPGNGGVRERIGAAMLRANQPFEAIRWFDLADQAGFSRAEMAMERGLAYDLIGDNAAAQRQYQLALAAGKNDEASRRYALSLVIAGDRRGAEAVIQPLLERRDRGAWRVRTFIMAIAGQSDEAEGIARATMPADLAAAISPYLRYMPRLTPAQQASAANLGRFPRAADIGRDDPQVVQYAMAHPRAPRVDAGLVPTGTALGGHGRDVRDSRAKRRRPGRDTLVAAVTPAVTAPAASIPGPAAVSAPWGLQPGAQGKVGPIAAAPAHSVSSQSARRSASAPVVLSKLDVPPGTPLGPLPLPVFNPTASAAAPSAVPAPAPFAAKPAPAPVPAPTPAAPKPAPVLMPAPIPAPIPAMPAVAAPQPAAPVPQPGLLPAQAAVASGDFGSMFNGFKPPEQEAEARVAAVDLAQIEALRQRDKASRAKDKAKANDRGDRPDGPTSVSRSSDAEPLAKSAKDRAAKSKADAEKTAKDNTAKEKAALDKACLELGSKSKAGKGKGAKAKVVKDKSRKDPVCPAETDKDKKGNAGKNQPTHVSRIWVQVLTGANRDMMGREWQRLVREAAVIKGRKPFITPWRNNFRLLTGPFDSDAQAQAFLGQLRKDGVSGFEWTSPAGQAVDSLQLK
jgi:Flp pilus assembly protein TadD